MDDLFIADPFYAEYAAMFGGRRTSRIYEQFALLDKHARDANSGLPITVGMRADAGRCE